MTQEALKQINVDIRDLPVFDNILDFSVRGLNHRPLTRLAFLLLDVHGEICWSCSTHRENIHELSLEDLEDSYAICVRGTCPRCQRSTLDRIRNRSQNVTNIACLLLGLRSGKDIATTIAMLYGEYRLLVLEDNDGNRVTPQQYYDIETPLALTNNVVGVQSTIAGQIDCLTSLRSGSEWFATYFDILKMYEAKHGIDLCMNTQAGVRYHNGVRVYSLSSKYPSDSRGRTRFTTALPEAAWLDTYDNQITASQILEILVVGTRTMQLAYRTALLAYKVAPPVPLIFIATSAHDVNDIAHVCENLSLFDRSIYFARHPTWEVNPILKRESYIKSESDADTKAMYLRDYATLVVA